MVLRLSANVCAAAAGLSSRQHLEEHVVRFKIAMDKAATWPRAKLVQPS
jgi:hypothetical protein